MARLLPSLQSIESIIEVTAQSDEVYHDNSSCSYKSCTIQRAVGCHSKRKSDCYLSLKREKQPATVPFANVWYDNVAHWPEFHEKKNKCRFCKTGTGHVYCTNLICTFVWEIQETVLLLIIANSCDNTHGIGPRSNYLLFSNI